MSTVTEKIIGWNILPEEIKAIKLKDLVNLTRTFESLINDIIISESERAVLETHKSVIIREEKQQSSVIDSNISWEDSQLNKSISKVDWSIEEKGKSSPPEDKDSEVFVWPMTDIMTEDEMNNETYHCNGDSGEPEEEQQQQQEQEKEKSSKVEMDWNGGTNWC
ncbi:uncharacterized protein LOC128387119 [Panonychus citri]|uniref:uncharacterized protein LOC128387119 n=1 Tax=Panonychus citri TaxID=50023 RepID=UPI0023075EA5|nr:uncharacterized protein LOC128387119 [Panonychus citri]